MHAVGLLCAGLAAASALHARAAEDVLQRSPALKQTLERLYKDAVHKRIGELTTRRGWRANDKTMGWGDKINWSDVWGPMYHCPALEHVGTIGDSGKWVCGVQTLLQRRGCVIYSIGSQNVFDFEAHLLNTTVCDIHVFDPTVEPALLRAAERKYNALLPRQRLFAHSVGIRAEDDDKARLPGRCYGGPNLLPPQPRHNFDQSALLTQQTRSYDELNNLLQQQSRRYDNIVQPVRVNHDHIVQPTRAYPRQRRGLLDVPGKQWVPRDQGVTPHETQHEEVASQAIQQGLRAFRDELPGHSATPDIGAQAGLQQRQAAADWTIAAMERQVPHLTAEASEAVRHVDADLATEWGAHVSGLESTQRDDAAAMDPGPLDTAAVQGATVSPFGRASHAATLPVRNTVTGSVQWDASSAYRAGSHAAAPAAGSGPDLQVPTESELVERLQSRPLDAKAAGGVSESMGAINKNELIWQASSDRLRGSQDGSQGPLAQRVRPGQRSGSAHTAGPRTVQLPAVAHAMDRAAGTMPQTYNAEGTAAYDTDQAASASALSTFEIQPHYRWHMQHPGAALLNEMAALHDTIVNGGAQCADNPGGVVPPPQPRTVAPSPTQSADAQAPHGDAETHCNMMSLTSVMQMLGHTWVDVLKVDVEGFEYETFQHLARSGAGMPFTQLQLEVHFGWSSAQRANFVQLNLLKNLLSHGLRPMSVEPNIYFNPQACMEFALINMNECGNVVTPL